MTLLSDVATCIITRVDAKLKREYDRLPERRKLIADRNIIASIRVEVRRQHELARVNGLRRKLKEMTR